MPTGGILRVTGRRFGALAVLLYLPAWFLPTIRLPGESFGGGPTFGWEAFLLALRPGFGSDVGGSFPLRAWMVASALSNVVLVVACALLSWRPGSVTRALVGSLAAATLINTYWFLIPDMRGDLRVGYYLWLAAYALGTLAAHATVCERVDAAPRGATAA